MIELVELVFFLMFKGTTRYTTKDWIYLELHRYTISSVELNAYYTITYLVMV